jgi:hypothetical protein
MNTEENPMGSNDLEIHADALLKIIGEQQVKLKMFEEATKLINAQNQALRAELEKYVTETPDCDKKPDGDE